MADMRHAHQPFARLLTPQARRTHLPRATWATTLAAALSLARLLADLHAEGYVVGDLKPDNLWVDAHGGVAVADVDSWQFTDGGEVFAGRMGSPGHTAPERIGAPAGTAPDRAGDEFVLAVLVHELLMCGLHPFAGHPAGDADYLSYDDNVLHGRCRLLDRTSVVLPRSAPPLDLLPRRLTALFRAAFGGVRPPRRPGPKPWPPNRNRTGCGPAGTTRCTCTRRSARGARGATWPNAVRTTVRRGPRRRPRPAPPRSRRTRRARRA